MQNKTDILNKLFLDKFYDKTLISGLICMHGIYGRLGEEKWKETLHWDDYDEQHYILKSITITGLGYGGKLFDIQQYIKNSIPNYLNQYIRIIIDDDVNDCIQVFCKKNIPLELLQQALLPIDSIKNALRNRKLWLQDGNGFLESSVPGKLLTIMNEKRHSPIEMYQALQSEAQRQLGKKRSLLGQWIWMKPKERPLHVTELLKNIIEEKEIDIEKLKMLKEKPTTTQTITELNNIENDVKPDNDGLLPDENIFRL